MKIAHVWGCILFLLLFSLFCFLFCLICLVCSVFITWRLVFFCLFYVDSFYHLKITLFLFVFCLICLLCFYHLKISHGQGCLHSIFLLFKLLFCLVFLFICLSILEDCPWTRLPPFFSSEGSLPEAASSLQDWKKVMVITVVFFSWEIGGISLDTLPLVAVSYFVHIFSVLYVLIGPKRGSNYDDLDLFGWKNEKNED